MDMMKDNKPVMKKAGMAENTPEMLSDIIQQDVGEGMHHVAAMGQSPTRKSWEERTYDMAHGAETPDGSLEGLALHHEHGKEGAGSKADQELEHEIHEHMAHQPERE